MKKLLQFGILLFFALLFLSGCTQQENNLEVPPSLPGSAVSPTEQEKPSATLTPLQPTATTAPMAIYVNGEGILQEDYDAEMQRYQASLVELDISEDKELQVKTVQEDLIAQTLLAQAAIAAGFDLDDTELLQRKDQLVVQVGGEEKYSTWLKNNYFDETSFLRSLRRSILATWQRDQIVEAVPAATEQVHAQQILLNTRSKAEEAYRQLESGTEFATLAYAYDPLIGGDLGWFPRGFLTIPIVEQAAFKLEPGQYSEVIESMIGFHIVYVVERDSNYPLSPEALSTLQHQVLQQWINDQRSQASIEFAAP